jgi:sensor histidine kinase YesM
MQYDKKIKFDAVNVIGFILFGVFLLIVKSNSVHASGSDPLLTITPDRFTYYISSAQNGSIPGSASLWKPVTMFTNRELRDGHDFWIRIELPESNWEEPTIYMTAFLKGFMVFMANQNIYTYGEIPDTPSKKINIQYHKNHFIPLNDLPLAPFLYIRIFYSSDADIGEIYTISIGSKEDIINNMLQEWDEVLDSNMIDVCLGFLLFVTGLGSLFMFVIRWHHLDYPFLFFGVFTFCVGITYLSDINPLFILNISPKLHFYIKSISFLLVPVGLFGFTETMFPTNRNFILRRIWQFHLLLAAAAIIMIHFQIDYSFLILIVLTINCFLSMFVIIKTERVEKDKIKITFISFFLLFIILLITQIFERLKLLPLSFDFFGWGILFFVFALGYVLVQHYQRTSLAMHLVSLELEKNKSELYKLQKENLISQLEALKNQIDPHFLFNNFSTLTSIIEENQETAVNFVEELSNVYRYVLQTRVHSLVSVKEELTFIQSYLFLMTKRFGKNLTVSIDIPEKFHNLYILPFSLQLLIENAIKHNIISMKKPLTIEIFIHNDNIVIRNNLQKKTIPVKSAHVGLANIENRYRLVSDKQVRIMTSDLEFRVEIPLLVKKGIEYESINC